MNQKFLTNWNSEVQNSASPRLEFYKTIKKNFGYEKYLDMKNFEFRKNIAKIRCSSHILEIEKGRHSKKIRSDRLCSVCSLNEVETEEHFLTKCPRYHALRSNYSLTEFTNNNDLFTFTTPNLLGQFITQALQIRKTVIDCQQS